MLFDVVEARGCLGRFPRLKIFGLGDFELFDLDLPPSVALAGPLLDLPTHLPSWNSWPNAAFLILK